MDNNEALQAFLGEPPGAAPYIKSLLEKRKLSDNKAAQMLNVSQSTLSRLFSGGELSESLAAKIYRTFGLSTETMFDLEAKRKTYKANLLAQNLGD